MTGKQQNFRIGLTGGIASGKTAVGDMFAARGAALIDTDLLAREVVAPGQPGLAAIVTAFGDDILTPAGRLDRAGLRDRVFADPAVRQELDAILHPLIAALMLRRSAAAAGPYLILVIPLLVETGFQHFVDRVLVIDCDPQLQMERLMRRDGSSPEQARQILAAQADRDARLAAADDLILNHGSMATLERQVDHLHELYLGLATHTA